MDTAAYSQLYFGSVEWAESPYEEFRTNRSRGWLEAPMLLFVEQPAAIVEITLS